MVTELMKSLSDAFGGADIFYSKTVEGYPVFVDGLYVGVVSHGMANDPNIASMGSVVREILLTQRYSAIVNCAGGWKK